MVKQYAERITILILCIFSFSAAENGSRNNDVVKNIDLDQFAGTWYEIARLPNLHEKELVEVTSTFTRTNKGYAVVNRGYKGSRDGKCTTLKGEIVIPDPAVKAAMKLKVWLLSLDYKIIDVDKDNYQYALVTSDSKKYLWIMSKSPSMNQRVFNGLVNKARAKGYNVDQLEKVQQIYNCSVAEHGLDDQYSNQ